MLSRAFLFFYALVGGKVDLGGHAAEGAQRSNAGWTITAEQRDGSITFFHRKIQRHRKGGWGDFGFAGGRHRLQLAQVKQLPLISRRRIDPFTNQLFSFSDWCPHTGVALRNLDPIGLIGMDWQD